MVSFSLSHSSQRTQQQSAISVNVFPWAGDIPYFDIKVDNFRCFFQAPEREFWVYRNLRAINASPPHNRPWPMWSIVVTNQEETLFIWQNADDVNLSINHGDDQHVVYRINTTIAMEVSRSLLEKLETHCTNKTVTLDKTVNPSGLYHEYICEESKYSFE